jgi:hypothetical protein
MKTSSITPGTDPGYNRRRDLLLRRIRTSEWEWSQDTSTEVKRKSVRKRKNKITDEKSY